MSKLRLPTEHEVWHYAVQVPVATKDYGIVPISPWGTQRALLHQILTGLQADIHQFIVLKSRQVGASTFLLILTLFWMHRYPGLQGLTVTDSEENKQYFRDVFLAMVEDLALREAPGPVVEESPPDAGRALRARNQVQIAWQNGSRLLLQTAGKRTWSRLGVGRGLSFMHGTEIGLWTQGMRALTYLRSAFSEINPAALYVFEGTARGKNWYYDLWTSAMKAKTIQPIFLGWWLREDNRIARFARGGPKGTPNKLFTAYASGTLTAKEREWDHLLRKREKVSLTMEQWAWRRWYVAEKAGGSARLADQEMPTVWEDAFSASQERPFLDEVTEQRLKVSVTEPETQWVYKWGGNMEDTRPEPAGTRDPMLRVWAPPDNRPVVVAAVPGRSMIPDDPSWVVSVWAAELEQDRFEQVAEFHSELNLGLQPFAWVCLHLAGAYGAQHRNFILEVSGLGMGVLAEIKRLVNTGWGTTRAPGFRDMLGSIRHYVYRRPNTMVTMGALQWKSKPETHGMILQRLRDQLQRGSTVVRSKALADEVARLEGRGDTYDPTGVLPRGHRAGAAALAVESYAAQLFPMLKKHRAGQTPTTVGGRAVQEFFASLGRR